MNDRKIIQSYINNFRRHLSAHLKPGIGLSCKVIPVKGEGAILEFSLGPGIKNDDQYTSAEQSVNAALGKIKQRMFAGNLSGVKFGGTNISMEPNRIILIKGEDKITEWDNNGARNDVKRIVTPPTARRQ